MAERLIDPPVFTVSTPQAFYELLLASGSKDPNAMKAFVAAHPEFAKFADWAKNAPWTGSYAEERFNSLNSFVFADGSGADHVVRWSLLPAAQPVAVTPDELAKRGPDFLEQEIAQRVASAPQRWTMVVTVANPDDPTADPTAAWPANRRSIEVGAHSAACPGGVRRSVPRYQFRSHRPAVRNADVRRTVSRHARPRTQSRTTYVRRRPRIIPAP